MRPPLLAQLTTFARAYSRLVWEFCGEVLFLWFSTLFLIGTLADWWLWSGSFYDANLLRKTLWALCVVGVGVWCVKFAPRLRKIPHTPQETTRLLRQLAAMQESEKNAAAAVEIPTSLENAVSFLVDAPTPHESAELRNATAESVGEELSKQNILALLNTTRMHRARPFLRVRSCVVFVLLLVFFAHFEGNRRNALFRFANPWGGAQWNLRATLSWEEFPASILSGENFNARIVSSKDVPYLKVFVWESEDSTQPVEMIRVSKYRESYPVRFRRVRQTFFVSASLEGASPHSAPRHRVEVLTYPTLANSLTRVFPPSYTGRAPYTQQGDVEDLYGARVGILITADRPLRDAKVRFDNQTYFPGKSVAGSAQKFIFTFELLRDGNFALELTDRNGLTSTLDRREMRVSEDAPPESEALAPTSGRLLLPGASIEAFVSGTDDYGLARLGFRWAADDAPNSSSETEPQKTKWANYTLWEETNSDMGERFNSARMRWDMTPLVLSPGTLVRMQPIAEDSAAQISEGEEILIQIVSPEEAARVAKQNWTTLMQELRRLEGFLSDACGILERNATEGAGPSERIFELQSLTQTMARLADEKGRDGLLSMAKTMVRDLDDNPSFVFQKSVTSKEQLEKARNLSAALSQIAGVLFPQWNHEIVRMSKGDAFSLEGCERALDIARRMRQEIRPYLEEQRHEESWQSFAFEFEQICDAQEKISRQTMDNFQSQIKFEDGELRVSKDIYHQQGALARETYECGVRYAPFHEAGEALRDIALPMEGAFCALKEGRPLDASRHQKNALARLDSMRTTFFSPSESPLELLQKKLERMRDQQEEVVRFFEELRDLEKGAQSRAIRRAQRAEMLRFLEAQRNFAAAFRSDENYLPLVLRSRWASLCENLSISIAQFEIFARQNALAKELIDDHFFLQLEIIDQLAEMVDIVRRATSAPNEFRRESDLENHATPKKEDAATSESSEPNDAPLIISPDDILILKSMQEGVLEASERLVAPGVQPMQSAERAEELEYLASQQEKITHAASEVGFKAGGAGTFAHIFTQMTQVAHLFRQGDVSDMNLNIQREIVYNLASSLSSRDDSESEVDSGGATTDEDLSENRDSESAFEKGDENLDDKNPEDDAAQNQTADEETTQGEKILLLQNKVWGELPQREQDRARGLPPQKWIKGYERTIQMYYKYLSEGTE
ncbi:MAG: hypothetical protein Q4D38_04720 [Planctomycetia bacterium]|nr:hypothetical protein [Planctomycetia bacterium]